MSCPLYVDTRAGSVELFEWLPADTEPVILDYGDAMILGNGPTGSVSVGVEVKSVTDLLQSADTGRLAGHQLPGLLALYDVPYLLYFGSYRPGPDGELQVRKGKMWRNYRIGTRPVPYGYLESFLMDVSSTGCRIKHVYNAQEAASWLRVAHRWWSKEWSAHKGLKQFDQSKNVSLLPGLSAEQELLARMIQQLPGLGFGKAVAASAHFASVADMAKAGAGDWQRVPGIGKVLAQEAVKAINRRV